MTTLAITSDRQCKLGPNLLSVDTGASFTNRKPEALNRAAGKPGSLRGSCDSGLVSVDPQEREPLTG